MDMQLLSDEVLLAQIANQQAGALALLYDRYAPAVLAVVLLVVRERQAAEELVVQFFWAVWQQGGTLPTSGPTIRNRLMLYARRMAQEWLGQAVVGGR
jgi:hypothetical protein